MILKFLAKDDLLVPVPGTSQFAGQVARYVGREWSDAIHGFPAVAEPYCVEEDSEDGRRLLKLARRDRCLLPADPETATRLGVPFVKLTLESGAMVPAGKGSKQ